MSIGFWDKLTHVLKPLSGVTNLFGRTKAGLTPQAPSGNGTTHYLREDGEWIDPININKLTILDMLHPVGTIIESTTCDTMAKVVAAYGGTTWKQHTGYVLRGASSGVVANSNVKTGGNDNAIVVKHKHTTPNHSHTFTGTAANYNSGGITANHYHGFTSNTGGEHWHFVASPSGHTWSANFGGGTRATTFGFTPSSVNGNTGYGDHGLHAEPNSAGANSNHAHSGNTGYVSSDHVHTTTVTPYGTIGNANPTTNETGSDGTNANIPNYKSVYIWERTA